MLTFPSVRPLMLGLPFTIYEFTLTHRLLEGLQAVSRFLLRAVALGTTTDKIVNVTALSAETIAYQFDYLRHQGYLDQDSGLTELGRQLVEIERHLPTFTVRIGIDRFCGKNIIVIPEAAPPPVVALNTPDASVPENRHVNYFVQQKSLSKILLADNGGGLLKFLTYFWAQHADLLGSQQLYLDYTIRPLSGHPSSAITVSIPSKYLTPVEKLRADEAGVTVPVLCIERAYAPAADYPWSAQIAAPDRFLIELFGNTLLADRSICTNSPDAPCRLVPERSDSAPAPALPPVELPMGVAVKYRFTKLYANFGVACSLMDAVRNQYPFLILGDQFGV